MRIEKFVGRLEAVKQTGDRWTARCPAHEDRKPSLSISEGSDGRILLHCHAGCSTEAVLQRLGLSKSDLFPEKRRNGGHIAATYDYTDEDGKLLFQVVRYQPKDFRQRRPDGRDGWTWNLNGVRRVLYRLPELVEGVALKHPVYVVEGEKDCDRLAGEGLIATTTPGGAGKWRTEYTPPLTGAQVIIVPDCDEPGRKHAEGVAGALHGKASSVRILTLPGLPEHGDVSDWLDTGHSVKELTNLAAQAPEWEPSGDDDAPDVGLTVALADAIQGETAFARDDADRLFVYDGGVYRERGARHVRARVKTLLNEWRIPKKWSRHRADEVVAYFEADAPILQTSPPADVVNVKNGLLRVGGRLEDHRPDFLGRIQLPVTYDPDASCPDVERFLNDVLPDAETVAAAWELFGWLMVPYRSVQKAVLLLGDGANGKSVFLSLLRRFLGPENTASVSLQKLEADRFACSGLVGKLADICPDLPSTSLTTSGTFKAITGGDMLQAEYKYRTAFTFVPFARLVFSANQMPRSADASEAFFRRWLVIPFNRTFPAGDPHTEPSEKLLTRLTTPGELSGVLNRALEGLRRVRQRGQLAESPAMLEAAEEFRSETDPLAVWLAHNTVEASAALVSRSDLIKAYGRDAERNGHPPLPPEAFGRAFRRLRPNITSRQRMYKGSPKTRCYEGIGLRDDAS